MTLHIPSHIDMTRRIAAQQAADVTRLTVEEQQLQAECDQHQAEYEAERARLDAELREAAEKAKEHLDRLTDAGRRLKGRLTDVGYQLQQHRDEAEQAQQSIADWCTRQGIDPATLPPLRDTGPLPVVAAPPEPAQPKGVAAVPPTRACGNCGGEIYHNRLLGQWEHVRDREARCDVEDPDGHFADPSPDAVPLTPLPSTDGADALLEQGRRMADPAATRADLPAGGDQPEQGEFQGETDA